MSASSIQNLKLISTNLYGLVFLIYQPCFKNARSSYETSSSRRSRDRQTCGKRNQNPGKKNDKGELIAMNVKVGDRVLFGKYSGQTVKVDGDELLVMKEDDLFAVVEK